MSRHIFYELLSINFLFNKIYAKLLLILLITLYLNLKVDELCFDVSNLINLDFDKSRVRNIFSYMHSFLEIVSRAKLKVSWTTKERLRILFWEDAIVKNLDGLQYSHLSSKHNNTQGTRQWYRILKQHTNDTVAKSNFLPSDTLSIVFSKYIRPLYRLSERPQWLMIALLYRYSIQCRIAR